jgi:hypothetical protein
MSESLTVKKSPVLVTLSFFDQHREQVVVFLPEDLQQSRTLVQRLLRFFNNAEEEFLVARHQNGKNTIIIRKDRVRWAELSESIEVDEQDRVGERRRIAIAFPRGDSIRGQIYNDLPPAKRRVFDFLNQRDPFFFLEGDLRLYLVNRRATSRVFDPPFG